MPLPKLVGLKTHVSNLDVTRGFWARHFALTPTAHSNALRYELDDITWEMLPGGRFCGTRGPHGALPVFAIDDFGHARGYLLAHHIPIVFEELIPGLNLLIFLDADSNPFELAQETEPRAWDITQRKELRAKRRQDEPRVEPIPLQGVTELTLYAHDITASVRFWREVVGLPVGLSYFAHVHLAAENVAVVLRTTRWQCKAPDQPHGSEPVFAIMDLEGLAKRLAEAGVESTELAEGLIVRDPAGIWAHFVAAA